MVKHILSISNKLNTYDLILIVNLLLFSATAAQPQEKIADGDTQKVSPSFILQEKIRQWVETQKLRGKESADWSEQKKNMASLNEIRQKEIGQIDALIESAGKRLSDATTKKDQLLAEKETLKIQREIIQERVEKLEASLRQKVGIFPDPLLSKVSDEVERIRDEEIEGSVQDRLRDIVAILSAASDFGYTMTITSEIRSVGDNDVEVEVLYLGFSGAWYVSKNGKTSGWGNVRDGAWNWVEDSSVARPLSEAMEMYRKQRAPDYIPLNFNEAVGK
jgi:hypothetical protein